MENTALITGCSTGIGHATAERFNDAEWEVYATARDPTEIRDLDSHGCRTAELDVTDTETVEATIDKVFEEQGQLDCLVNNAGYGQLGPIEDVPMDKIREQFDVNTFGPLRLIHAVLPRMREHGRGTIINVGAGVGGLSVPGIGVYTGSKYALQSLTDTLRQEVSDSGVDVVLIEPGAVATDFYDRATKEIVGIDHTPTYTDLYRVLDDIEVIERGGPGINQPERVAGTILEAASVDHPNAVYRVGPFAIVGTLLGGVVRGRVRDTASRAGITGLASEPAQRFLEKWRK